MRLSRVLWVVGGGLGLVVPALPVGCFSPEDDCVLTARCPPSVVSTSSGSGGEGGTVNIACIPSQASGPVASDCGVFVSTSGLDMNDGSMGSPVATIGHALQVASAGSKRVYVCAEAFTEAIQVPAGISVYGGLDCKAGWSWSEAGRTTLTAAPDQIPVRTGPGVGTTAIENFAITAADAMQPGGSSIGMLADSVTLQLAQCDLTAGKAADGAAGQTPMEEPTKGADGQKGTNACTAAAMVLGGEPGMTMCGDVVSQGGRGGSGGIPGTEMGYGQKGEDGQPADAASGLGGKGTDTSNCDDGDDGKDGDTGGPGAGGTALGTISSSGYAGADGAPGSTGTPGQGGGGGGGAKSGSFCASMPGSGASGGAGGAGGCGGKGGEGGKAGGSSIALVLVNSTPTFAGVKLTAAAGGKGGAGAPGQVGAESGLGSVGGASSGTSPSKSGCKGGDGGYGGDGGPSGGGRGGHSIGIAYLGGEAPADGLTVTVGTAGEGGLGAITDGGDAGGDGAPGVVSETQNFGAPTP